MPQLGPLSWLLLPLVVLFCLVLLYCSVWWGKKDGFVLQKGGMSGVKSSGFIWKW